MVWFVISCVAFGVAAFASKRPLAVLLIWVGVVLLARSEWGRTKDLAAKLGYEWKVEGTEWVKVDE